MATPSLPKVPPQIGIPGGAPSDIRGVGQFLTQIIIALNAWISQTANLLNNLIIPAIVNAVGTVTRVNTGTGLTGGPVTVTGTISLANTAVTPGNYISTNLTIDQQGRITAAANGGGGSVSSVGSGTGLTGGPITTSGTLAIDTSVVPEYSGTLTSGALITGAGTHVITADANWTIISGELTGNFATSAPGILAGLDGIYVAAADGNSAGILQDAFASGDCAMIWRAAAGTGASPAALTAGYVIGDISVRGYNGSAYTTNRASLRAVTAELWTTTANGTAWVLLCTPQGSQTNTQRLRVQSDGTVYAGTANSNSTPNTGAGTFNADNGYFRGGASSPTNIQTGKAATQKTTASPGSVTATSPTYKMLGFAGTITPKWNTVALVTFTGQCNSGTLADVATLVLSYGTGAAPSNGGALAGTQVGSVYTFTQAVASDVTGFSVTAVITGLSAGTAYWLDLAVGSSGGHAVTFGSTGCSAIEP